MGSVTNENLTFFQLIKFPKTIRLLSKCGKIDINWVKHTVKYLIYVFCLRVFFLSFLTLNLLPQNRSLLKPSTAKQCKQMKIIF